MKSLERAYAQISSGTHLLVEEVDNSGLSPIPDLEVQKSGALPPIYAHNLVPGSGKSKTAADETSPWSLEYLLKFPTKDWTDGTEEEDVTYDYVERQVTNELPGDSGDNPGQPFCRGHAIVDDEHSNKEFIVVRCIIRGGMDI